MRACPFVSESRALEVAGDLAELVDGSAVRWRQRADRIFQAMIEMIVDQRLLGLSDRLFHGMQLLGDIEAGLAALYHDDDRAQMAVGALQALDDLGMRFVDVSMSFNHTL
jgi:hypothetical protein